MRTRLREDDKIIFVAGDYKGNKGVFQRYTRKKAWVFNEKENRAMCVETESIAKYGRAKEAAENKLLKEVEKACSDYKKAGFSADRDLVMGIVETARGSFGLRTLADYEFEGRAADYSCEGDSSENWHGPPHEIMEQEGEEEEGYSTDS
jgi:hypothetical protein